MALAEGSGKYVPPKPRNPMQNVQPSPAYSAIVPSGPYAGRPGRTAPLAQMQAMAAAPPAWGRNTLDKFGSGFFSAFNPLEYPKIPGNLNQARKHPLDALKAMFTTPEGLGGLASMALPFAPKGAGLARGAGTAAERIASYPTGAAVNDLRNLGQHADLAENVLAHKAFDRELATAKRKSDLSKAPSLGNIMRTEGKPRPAYMDAIDRLVGKVEGKQAKIQRSEMLNAKMLGHDDNFMAPFGDNISRAYSFYDAMHNPEGFFGKRGMGFHRDVPEGGMNDPEYGFSQSVPHPSDALANELAKSRRFKEKYGNFQPLRGQAMDIGGGRFRPGVLDQDAILKLIMGKNFWSG